MPRLTSVRFGPCEINIAQRELRVCGELKALHHRAFDLLLCLLEKHDQVVTKEELASVLGGVHPISDNMLAKIVMQARQAIGDSAAKPRWIKTVSRVGYRLAAERVMRLDDADPLESSSGRQAVSSQADVLRLAFLPLVNCTGNPQHGWIEHGVAALVVHALESAPRMVPVPPEMVRAVLGDVVLDTDIAARAAELRRALGVNWVVHASLHRAAMGLRLDYQCHGTIAPVLGGSLFGSAAFQLGELLAQRLTEELLPGQEQTLRFQSGDPLFNQLFARALQCYIQRQVRDTIVYLRAAVLVDPQSISARLLLLNAMVRCGDKAATALSKQLLEEAQGRADDRLEGMVHEAMMDLMFRGDVEIVREHTRLALAIAGRYGSESWALRVRSRAGTEATTRSLSHAIAQYECLRKAKDSGSDRLQWAIITFNLATARVALDDLHRARTLFEEVVEACNHYRWRWLEAAATSNLSAINLAWGKTATARDQQALAEALGSSIQDDLYLGGILDQCTALHLQTGDHAELGRRLRRCAALRRSEQPMPRAYVRMAHGVRASLKGRTGAARRWMTSAIRGASAVDYVYALSRWLVWLLLVELKSGEFGNARQVCQRVRELHFYRESADLRLWVVYAHAAELHGQGQASQALDTLISGVTAGRPGQADAHARMAAAWLCFEQNRPSQAVNLMQPLGSWLDEHPLGLSLAARLAVEQGNTQQALVLQRRAAVACTGASYAGPVGALLSTYEALAQEHGEQVARRPALVPLPRLLTLL